MSLQLVPVEAPARAVRWIPRLVVDPPRQLFARLVAGVLVPAGDAVALALCLGIVGGPDSFRVGFGLVAFAVLRTERPCRLRLSVRASETAGSVIARLAVAFVVLAPLFDHVDDLDLIRAAPLLIGAVLAMRAVTFAAVRTARTRGLIAEPTVIVGAGAVAQQCAEGLMAHREYGLRVVGFVDTIQASRDASLPLPVLGDADQLERVVQQFGIQRAVVAFGYSREHEIVRALRSCSRHGLDVYVVPRFFELGVCPDSATADRIWGTRLVCVRSSLANVTARRMKRLFDIGVAGTVLLLTAPVLVAAAVATKLSSPGPVLFRQRRVGYDNRVIEVLKFRSMRVNTDSDTTWSVKDDARITPVGRVLRNTNLDELPQLFNVLRGDMSLVGPRPERSYFVDRFNATIDTYNDRHRAPAGLSGWAQVHGLRGDTSIEERVRFDNDYIEHWSLWFDVVILFRTFLYVLGDAVSGHRNS